MFTSDPERGLAVARSVRTGAFGINGYAPDPLAPFGGFTESGIGREWVTTASASTSRSKPSMAWPLELPHAAVFLALITKTETNRAQTAKTVAA